MPEHDPIRVVHWGLDPVGIGIANTVWRRAGLMPVGAIDTISSRVGQDLGDLMGFGEHLGISVSQDPMAVLSAARPDVTIITGPHQVDEVGPQILQAMEAGSNVICLAEGMAYPWASRPDLADGLDELAHAHGVTVLGTGLNPGFVLDTLVIALTGCCLDVERIRASRSIAVTGWGKPVWRELGIGLSPSHFMERFGAMGTPTQAGFAESIHLIADALGWKLDRVEEEYQPILAQVRREAEGVRIDPGQVAGVQFSAVGYVDGMARIILEHSQQIAPALEGIQTGDFIDIEGQPPIRLAIQPEIDSLKGAAALAVNLIPAVLQAGPGLKTMVDLPVPRAILGDVRMMLETRGPTVEEALARGWHAEL